MTDSELVASIVAGDLRAFEALIRRHKRTLFRTARAILRDDADAEDAVQEACLRAYKALGSFRGESKLSTWLVRVAANEALMRRRERKAAAAHVDVDPQDLGCRSAEPERLAESRQAGERMQERLAELPEVYRSVFRLRAFEELSVSETAAALRIAEPTVRTRYFRARKLLRESMLREAARCPSLECPLVITEADLERLILLRPHAALLREINRAAVVSSKAAALVEAVTMNTQVLYTDETIGVQKQVNIVFPHQAGGCSCSVSILAPIGTALIGLRAGQSIEWSFSESGRRRLRVDRVLPHDCPALGAREAV